jgi:hypothetical protein
VPAEWDTVRSSTRVGSRLAPKTSYHGISFTSKLLNGPNKLECYITQGWEGLSGTNTLADWAHSYVWKKIVVNTVLDNGEISCQGQTL